MTNGNMAISNLQILESRGLLLKGQALVNGVAVLFYYNPKADKFTASSLLHSEAELYMTNPPKNWMYLVCGSIAHLIKDTYPVS